MIKNTRHIFFDIMERLMEKDKTIWILTGDLGYSYIEKIQQKFPDRVLNVGCAEQNMIGVAAGLVKVGKKPYVYSGTPFVLFRPLEQVRNDIAYQKLNVKLIGVAHSGFLGFTHNLLHEKEDINICENIGLKSYVPTLKTLEKILLDSYNKKEAVYIRL